jgi:hypothetical protein
MEMRVRKRRGTTGPRTLEGRQRSRGNARKHGLASLVLHEDRSPRLEQLAKTLANEQSDSDVLHAAKRAAEARIRLEQVMEVQRRLLSNAKSTVDRSGQADKIVQDVSEPLQSLKRLESYERRALTRWFRCLDQLQHVSTECCNQ